MFNTIQDVMKGLTPGDTQTVGNMTVIPLISDIIDNTIASPKVLEMETQGYGTVVVYNTGTDDESGLTISPVGNMIITRQAAQNHTLPDMKIIKKGKRLSFANAACIQETQGGYIRRDKYRIMLLPLALREDALKTRKEHNHGKLWNPIRRFNQSLGLRNIGHMEYFIKNYKKEMDAFVAQFEVVPNQVGAIILIDGEVVGIERCPNYHFFKTMWKPLIRECYGSMSIQKAKASGYQVPKSRLPLSHSNIRTLSDIRAALVRAKAEEGKKIRQVVNSFIKDKFKTEVDEKTAGFRVETLSNPQFKGQMVRKNKVPLMFSFVKTKDWIADPNQERFAAANEFRM